MNEISPYKDRTLDPSKPVQVYRNLHLGGYSIRQGGVVRAHAKQLCLKHVRFIVNERGRQRILRTRKKAVHAYAEGILCDSGMGVTAESTRLPAQIVYNPFTMSQFQTKNFTPQMEVRSALFCTVNRQGVFAAYFNSKE